MENIVTDIPGIVVYLDDIVVTGKYDAIHVNNLNMMLKRLQENSLKVR